MLTQFRDARLGMPAAWFTRVDGAYVAQNVARQRRRRRAAVPARVLRKLGGYLPLRHGGIDAAAEIMARQKGWRVRTFADIGVSSIDAPGRRRPTASRRREGARLYSLGYRPLFIARCIRRSLEPPAIIGSLAMLYGYLMAACGAIRSSSGRTMPSPT